MTATTKKGSLSDLLPIALLLTVCVCAEAANLTVPGQFPSIQSAADAASSGDTIRIAAGTYYENIVIAGKALTFTSEDGANFTIIDGNSAGPVITSDSDLTLIGFTIRNGENFSGGGVLMNSGGHLALRDNWFTKNVGQYGIAVFAANLDSLELVRNRFTKNRYVFRNPGSNSSAGYVLRLEVLGNQSSQLTDNLIADNELIGASAAGIWVQGVDLVVDDNEISSNTSNGLNGVVGTFNQGVRLNFNRIIGNDGIGMWLNNASDLATRNLVRGQRGGGALVKGGQFLGNFIEYNQDSGVEVWQGTVAQNFIRFNQAINEGGGIKARSGGSHLNNNVIFSNSAQLRGGGIWIGDMAATSPIYVTNNLLVSNIMVDQSFGRGTGIHMEWNVFGDVANNFIYSITPGGMVWCDKPLQSGVFRNNNVWPAGAQSIAYGGTCPGQTGNAGNISQNVQLLGTTHVAIPLGSSPTIDAGDPVAVDASLSDFDGIARPIDGNQNGLAYPDMGATEHDPQGVIKLDSEFYEFSENSGSVNIKACRVGGTLGQVSAQLSTIEGTAKANVDYDPVSTSITFSSGEQGCLRSITINLYNNGVRGSAKRFNLRLSEPTGGAQTGREVPVWITDNEGHNAQSYVPLIPGTSWQYLVNGAALETFSVLNQTQVFNGVAAQALQQPDGGILYATNDGDGYIEHASLGSVNQFLSPGVKLLSAEPYIGETISINGTMTVTTQGIVFQYPYNFTSTVEAIETMTFPHGFGEHDALKVRLQLSVSGNSQGVAINAQTTETSWLVKGIGPIKEIQETINFINNTTTTDTRELFVHTAPDNDGDGLDVVEEILNDTNPYSSDTDGDGLSDNVEVVVHKTDPLLVDSDADGLPDTFEIVLGQVHPTRPDSDFDGLSDGDEINVYSTAPDNIDTDGDGLIDGDEVNLHATDPLNADTDEDGYSDNAEVVAGTDPNDAASFPSQIREIPVLPATAFYFLVFVFFWVFRQVFTFR